MLQGSPRTMWCAIEDTVLADFAIFRAGLTLQRLYRVEIWAGKAEIWCEGSPSMHLEFAKVSGLWLGFVVCNRAYTARREPTLGPACAVQRLSRVEICAGRAEIWHGSSCSIHLQEPIGYKARPALCGVQQCIQHAELPTLGPVCTL